MRRVTSLFGLLPLSIATVLTGAHHFTWVLDGSNPSGYAMTATGSPMDSVGAALSLTSRNSTTTGYGAASGSIPADTFAGRRVRISADIETRDVASSASVWLRADSGQHVLILDNGIDQGIKGTTVGPGHMDVTAYVPARATRISLGFLLVGPGQATARNVRIVAQPVVARGALLVPEAQRELGSRRKPVGRDS